MGLEEYIERLERKLRWLDTAPDEVPTREQLYELFHDQLPVLTVRHLRIGSPFIVDLVVHGGATGTAIAAVYLLFRGMRNPKEIGAWLPRLLAGWHEGMREADEAKRLRLDDYPVVSKFIEATRPLSTLELREIDVHGTENSPQEIREIIGDVMEDE